MREEKWGLPAGVTGAGKSNILEVLPRHAVFRVAAFSVLIRVTVRFFNGHPLPYLLGVCRPDRFVLPPRQPSQAPEMP
jgi:hypothetical protein